MSEGSATRTADATAATVNQPTGEVGSHVARDPPQTTSGHKPGVLASENDAAPESHATTLPAGTAPKANTFQPNVKTPDVTTLTETTQASETVTGATSADVHDGLGHPGQGQSSNELHHDGGKTHKGGLQGVGAMGAESDGDRRKDRLDTSAPEGMAASQKLGGEVPSRDEDRRMHNNPS